MKKKWVSFDVWGTLIKANPLYRPARNKLIAEILFPEITMSDLEWEKLIKKTKDFCDFSNEVLGQQMHWSQSILAVARDFFDDLPKIDFRQRFLNYKQEDTKLVGKYPPKIYSKETLFTLELLKEQEIPLSIICNTGFMSSNNLKDVFTKLNIRKYFKRYTFSDEENASKPSSIIFDAAYRHLSAREGIHVGDNPFSDGGSKKVGVEFLHINGDSGKTISEILKHI